MSSLLLVLMTACGTPAPEAPTQPAREPASEPARTEPLDVRALSFPAAWLAERIGGERVQVVNILPVGEDPPSWQPSGDLVAGLAEADLIVANGAGFEAWTATATLPEQRLVATAAGVEPIHLEGVTHSHGKEGEHSHAGLDPHTWSDPLAFTEQAEALAKALSQADPAGADAYEAHLAELKAELEAVHETLSSALAPAKGVPLAANHPAYNYLARRYALDLTSFDLDPEEPPSEASAARVAAWAEGAGDAPILLWEAQPSEAVRAALPEGLRHVRVDPLEQPGPDGYDYVAQATANAVVLATLFGVTTDAPSE